jgi:hypothetical protein
MANQQELSTQLNRVADRAATLAGRMDDERWSALLPGQTWSAHELFSHIAAMGTNLPGMIESFRNPTPDAEPFDPDANNEREVGKRKGMSRAEVLAEINAGHRAAASLVSGLGDEELASPVRAPWGEMVPLGDLVADIFVGHENRHLDQLEEGLK